MEFVPSVIVEIGKKDAAKGFRCYLTNIAGNSEPLRFGDAISKKMLFIPAKADRSADSMVLSVYSHGDILKLGLMCRNQSINPEELLEVIQR